MDILRQVLLTVGSAAIIIAGLSYLAKSLLTTWLATKVEEYKRDLKSEADISIERFKADLQRAATEHQVRFTKLHERRAEVIADLHARAVEAQNSAQLLSFGIETDPEKTRQLVKDLYEIVEKQRIYFPQKTSNLLMTLAVELRKQVTALTLHAHESSPLSEERREAMVAEATHVLMTRLPSMRNALEAQFRQILDGSNAELPTSASKPGQHPNQLR